MLEELLKKIKNEQEGFLTPEDIAFLAEHDRMRMILVRCGNGRFLTPAQNVKWFTEIITEHGGDYVRDCSLPING